jgi:hypothetical protein
LYRVPLPTLKVAISELMAEETRIHILKVQGNDPIAVLLTQASKPLQSETQNNYKSMSLNEGSRGRRFCKYCKKTDHLIEECQKLQYNKQLCTHQMHHLVAPVIASIESGSQSCVTTAVAPSHFSPELISQLAEQINRQLGSGSTSMALSPSILSASLSSTSTNPSGISETC